MKPLPLGVIARIVNSRLPESLSSIRVTGISKDSRVLMPGDLYVALSGERYDGHQFVPAAQAAGAVAALVARPVGGDLPQLVVDSPLHALQLLAAWYRLQCSATVIGITGSHGKTTCKDMLADILTQRYAVHKTPANFNGQIGVPLTLLGLAPHHQFMVLEMGISAIGEMAKLVHLARPAIGIFLNVAPVHTEFFGDLEVIVQEKGVLLSHLMAPKVAIINGDDPRVVQFSKTIEAQVIAFGFGPTCDYRGELLQADASGTTFCVHHADRALTYRIPLLGRHHIYNALAAVAAAQTVDIDPEAVTDALAGFKASNMRMHLEKIGGTWVINDAYNAAPQSMRAALTVLKEFPNSGKKIAVLGDMLELGPRSKSDHSELGSFVADAGIDYLFCYGPLSQDVAAAAVLAHMRRDRVCHCGTQKELATLLRPVLQPDDVVLVKGSRGMQMETIVTLCFSS